MLAQQFVNAISLGGVYALFALGFTLVFGVLNVVNLAHGAVFTLGAYAALQTALYFHAPLPAAIGFSISSSSRHCAPSRRRTWRRWSRPSVWRSF
jgi:branched-chain amino acid transport system permease protein